VLHSIKHVFGMGSITKVAKKAIRGDTIQMAAFHSWGWWPYKSKKNELMDLAIGTLSFSNQYYVKVTPLTFAWLTKPLGRFFKVPFFRLIPAGGLVIRPYPAIVRNVISGKSGNWFESFFVWSKMGITHGADLLRRLAIWGEPDSLFTQQFGSFFFISWPSFVCKAAMCQT